MSGGLMLWCRMHTNGQILWNKWLYYPGRRGNHRTVKERIAWAFTWTEMQGSITTISSALINLTSSVRGSERYQVSYKTVILICSVSTCVHVRASLHHKFIMLQCRLRRIHVQCHCGTNTATVHSPPPPNEIKSWDQVPRRSHCLDFGDPPLAWIEDAYIKAGYSMWTDTVYE